MAIKDDMEDVQEAVINELITDNGLNPLNLTDGSVSLAKLGSDVDLGQVNDGAVTTAKIGGGAVTTAKIGGGAVTTAKLGSDVDLGQVNDGAVTLAKLGSDVDLGQVNDGAVTTAKILNGEVTPAKLSQSYLPLTGGTVSGSVGIGVSAPTAKLSLPAQASGDSGVARFSIESAVDSNDFTIAQYEDGTGTYTQIGQNIILTSGGNVAVLDSAHKTAGITFDGRGNGALMFQTGAANANAERMRIDSSGNVGLGTTSIESWRLAVAGTNFSSGGGLAVAAFRDLTSYNTSNNGAGITLQGVYNSGGGYTNFATIQAGKINNTDGDYSTYLRFSTRYNGASQVEAMRIDNSGNVLVGKTVLAFNTAGVAMQPEGVLAVTRNASTPFILNRKTSAGEIAQFQLDGASKGNISVSATATAYNTSSDYRLKTDAQPMTGASARVQALNPVNFEWISDGTRVDGFLAHEAQEVVPEAVTGTKDAVDDEGNPEYQGIDQAKLVPLLTKALQEALTKIESLEARVASLENT
jgi:hypothetical protein